MKTEVKKRLDNPLLSSRLTGVGSLTMGSKTHSSLLVNPLLQSTSTVKGKETESVRTTSFDKNTSGTHAGVKPVSINLKQESLSLQSNRLLLGSKLTPLSSSVIGTPKTEGMLGRSLTTPSTKSALTQPKCLQLSVSSMVTNTLIKPSHRAKVTLAGSHQPSRQFHSKKSAENRQIVDTVVTDFEIPDYDFHFDVRDSEDLFWELDEETCFKAVDPELISLMISSEDANSKKVNHCRRQNPGPF